LPIDLSSSPALRIEKLDTNAQRCVQRIGRRAQGGACLSIPLQSSTACSGLICLPSFVAAAAALAFLSTGLLPLNVWFDYPASLAGPSSASALSASLQISTAFGSPPRIALLALARVEICKDCATALRHDHVSMRFGAKPNDVHLTLGVIPAKSLPSNGVIGGGNPAACVGRHWAPAFAGATTVSEQSPIQRDVD
jgi:hypothetical protein